MTAYRYFSPPQRAPSAQEAKAKRQAELDRVRKQRAAPYKRTAQAWMQEGLIIWARALKERYTGSKQSLASCGRYKT